MNRFNVIQVFRYRVVLVFNESDMTCHDQVNLSHLTV